MLQDPERFIQKDKGFFRCKKIQQPLCHGIKIVDKALQTGVDMKLSCLLRNAGDLCPDPTGRLKISLFTELSRHPVRLLFHPLKTVVQPHFIQDHFRCRKNAHKLQLLQRSLAQNIEASDRLYFVVPELDPEGIFLSEIENIEDVAADRKLSGTLNLVVFFISHRDQPVHRR